ncbi:hypothetical protein GGI43DRAFT_389540 [Trichoderma evansii]
MVFNYLNNNKVWDKFCATYQALYDYMGDFNTFYASKGQVVAIPNLQDEWEEFIRTALDSAVTRALAAFDMMYEKRATSSYLNPTFSFQWLINKYWNRPSFKLPGTCPHLGPTRV